MEMCPPSIAQLRALHPPARPCLCPCSRQLPCGSTGPTPAQGLGPRLVSSLFPSLSPSCIGLRGSKLPEMGIQGLCTKQSLLTPGDRPEVPALHPGVVTGGWSPLSCRMSAGLPHTHVVPPRPTKNGVWPRYRVGGGLPLD